jgi:hypothetical protein
MPDAGRQGQKRMGYGDDDDEIPPFSDDERKEIRALLEHEKRVKWFYASARIWIGWAIGAPVALLAAYQAIAKFLGLER